MTRTDIAAAWKAHVERKFPRGLGGNEVAGVCVTSADTFLAGCISYFVESGSLDAERLSVVRSTCQDLERVLPHLSGEARTYFEELLKLGRGVESHFRH